MKRCSSCERVKPDTAFYRHCRTKDGLQGICKLCHRKQVDRYQQVDYEKIKRKAREYYYNDLEGNRMKARERYRENKGRQRKYRIGIKKEVLTHYGNGKCVCVKCGFSDLRALSLDHIAGNGAEEKRKIGKVGVDLYNYLKSQGYPEGYQTLCMNCQFIKRAERREYGKANRVEPQTS